MSRLPIQRNLLFVLLGLFSLSTYGPAPAQDIYIPHKQSKPPGPALTPSEALARMTVPEGFHVELVAAEPDLVNPVAMAFDDAGRIYVTESFEYPRHEPGPGRDRIKILEDTNRDGQMDSIKIFAEGLNIPSGIAVGYGGVWVANAPDILFLQDTDGDDRADKQTVVATGFGRYDTHELPNALTWGPDGFLYGLNGVFNRSIVEQAGQTFDFTCALFRIDPVTKRFELFCEGTSNPWGVAFDDQGSAFISACVIDHLWHLTETGYYHRQGGPYPPHTWKIDSIVDYQHQMAAYCGIEYFDSPAYPAPYRNKLYMGNIHGGCINVDSVSRKGSTYQGTSHPDFLTANDVWFMPVAQKVGPDGCLYILDWYDRYHCYQDASADPEGIDRGRGRLYRVVYHQRPETLQHDLRQAENTSLVERLTDDNIFLRQRAALLLGERLRIHPQSTDNQRLWQSLRNKLNNHLASDSTVSPLYLAQTFLHAPQMTPQAMLEWLNHEDGLLVSWAVQAAATRHIKSPPLVTAVAQLSKHADPRVRLQVAIAAENLAANSATQWLMNVLEHSQEDVLLPKIVWQNLLPRMIEDQETILSWVKENRFQSDSLIGSFAPRFADRLLADVRPDLTGPADSQSVNSVLQIASFINPSQPEAAAAVLQKVIVKLQTAELQLPPLRPLLEQWQQVTGIQTLETLQLSAFAGQEKAMQQISEQINDSGQPLANRLALLQTIASIPGEVREAAMTEALRDWVASAPQPTIKQADEGDSRWRDALLEAIIQKGSDLLRAQLAEQIVLLPTGAQATIAERMSQRESTAILLLNQISAQRLSKDIVSPNQVRALATHRSDAIQDAVRSIWGTVRQEDSEERQQVTREIQEFLYSQARGNAQRGIAVYDRICGQCHQLHDRGFEVGPNITRNGRGSFAQLVQSVFDPSSVIGDAYKSVTVLTTDGRVLTGILTEQSEQRTVLKIQGGKSETIPAESIDELKQNPHSLMPEGLEQQMTRSELADLFAFLSLEKSPESSDNQTISGTPDKLHP